MSYFITTTNGARVQFSEDDVFTALANTWTGASDGYAKRYYEKAVDGQRKRWVKYFHREVMKAKDGEIIDHINQDKLDNRRENLRVADRSLNALNSRKSKGSVKYRGVFFNKQSGKYQAGITINGRTKYLGAFFSAKEASEVYLKAQKEYLNGV